MRPTFKADGYTWLAEYDGHMLAFGGHEPGIVAIAKAILPENGVFVDVGAHVGAFTVRLASEASKVFAVEAAPDTCTDLLLNLEMNDIHNVTVLNLAAWDRETAVFITPTATGEMRERRQADGSTRLAQYPPVGEVVEIRALPLDLMLADVPHIDLIKIDVEGAEAHVLWGAALILKELRPRIILEMHDRLFPGAEGKALKADVEAILHVYDYLISEPIGEGVSYHLVCTPRETVTDSP